MFRLIAQFHAYSSQSSFINKLRKSALKTYSDSSIANLDVKIMRWNPSIFQTEDWNICVKCANYFVSPAFRKIYNNLPVQLIHGDIGPHNIVISNGKHFFIDLDKIRTDVRLLEFASFCGWSFLERYFTLVEKDELFTFIETHYGILEEMEKEHFHSIVLLKCCAVLSWALREIGQGLADHNEQKVETFQHILKNAMKEITEIYRRIPQIREIIK